MLYAAVSFSVLCVSLSAVQPIVRIAADCIMKKNILKISNMKWNVNPYSGRPFVPWRHTDITKIIAGFSNYANERMRYASKIFYEIYKINYYLEAYLYVISKKWYYFCRVLWFTNISDSHGWQIIHWLSWLWLLLNSKQLQTYKIAATWSKKHCLHLLIW